MFELKLEKAENGWMCIYEGDTILRKVMLFSNSASILTYLADILVSVDIDYGRRAIREEAFQEVK